MGRASLLSVVWRAAYIVVPIGLALQGCGSRIDDNDVLVLSGEHVTYSIIGPSGEESAERLCAGTAEYVDAYAGLLKERFGLDGVPPVRYSWVPDGVDSIGACQGGTNQAGCASGGEAIGNHAVLEHELVHTVRQLGVPRAHSFLEEGVAEYLGGRQPQGPKPRPSTLIEEITALESGEKWNATRLALAGHFTSFLVTGLGLPLSSLSDLRNAGPNLVGEVADVVGLQEEDILELYSAHRRTTNHSYRDPTLSCALAIKSAASFEGGALDLRDTVECSDPSAIGEAESYVEREFEFDVDERGCYSLEYSAEETMLLWLEECSADIDRTLLLLQFPRKVFLEAAPHTVLVRTTGGTQRQSFSFQLARDPTSTAEDCF